MTTPPLLHLPGPVAYREHFVDTCCRGVIETHDGIRVYFRQEQFGHAFYESTARDGAKDAFSEERAQRMDWISATLSSPEASRYQGWLGKTRSYDATRKVALLYEDFVVITRLRLNRGGVLRANFITCFKADNNTAPKIRAAPPWTEEDCRNALR